MTSVELSQLLITVANGVTAFAIVQNLSYSYRVSNREVKIAIDRRIKWGIVGVTVVSNLLYLFGAWWCSTQALLVLRGPNAADTHRILESLTYGRCVAIVLFGALSSYLAWRLDHKHYWVSDSLQSGVMSA